MQDLIWPKDGLYLDVYVCMCMHAYVLYVYCMYMCIYIYILYLLTCIHK